MRDSIKLFLGDGAGVISVGWVAMACAVVVGAVAILWGLFSGMEGAASGYGGLLGGGD